MPRSNAAMKALDALDDRMLHAAGKGDQAQRWLADIGRRRTELEHAQRQAHVDDALGRADATDQLAEITAELAQLDTAEQEATAAKDGAARAGRQLAVERAELIVKHSAALTEQAEQATQAALAARRVLLEAWRTASGLHGEAVAAWSLIAEAHHTAGGGRYRPPGPNPFPEWEHALLTKVLIAPPPRYRRETEDPDELHAQRAAEHDEHNQLVEALT